MKGVGIVWNIRGNVMKAVVIYEAGGVDKLIYQDVETPTVKPGWSLVKVRASVSIARKYSPERAIRNRCSFRGF